jgi:hypothetical protein
MPNDTTTIARETQYAVYWPRSPRQVQLWDYVFRGDEVYALIEEAFQKRFPGVRFVSWREFGSTHGGEEREVVALLPKKFKELGVDAVISGMGC